MNGLVTQPPGERDRVQGPVKVELVTIKIPLNLPLRKGDFKISPFEKGEV